MLPLDTSAVRGKSMLLFAGSRDNSGRVASALTRRGARGAGLLITRMGCTLARLERSRVGGGLVVTSVAIGIAGRERVDGAAAFESVRVGDDIDAPRRDGAWKGVKPPNRPSSLRSSLLPARVGERGGAAGPAGLRPAGAAEEERLGEMERAAVRKETFDSSFLSMGIRSFSFGASSGGCSLPFPLSLPGVSVAKSSTTTGGDFMRLRVAERILCSMEERKRPLRDLGNALSAGGDWESEGPARAGVGLVDCGYDV